MAKKKILFILGVLDSGGVAKSLVSLLNTIDTKIYDVSLLLVSLHKGPFFDYIPSSVHIIQDELMANVGSVKGLKWLMARGKVLLALGTVLRLVIAVFSKPISAYVLSRLMPKIEGEYDLIVDYNGQQQTYYMVDKLQGKHKVAFFHSDYAKWPYYYMMDKRYYPKLDAIFSITPACVESLRRYFPDQAQKIKCMENISNPKLIDELASHPLPIERTHKYVLCTLGHVCIGKGSDMALEVARLLKVEDIDFEWWFVGAVSNDFPYEDIVRKYGLEDNIKYVGVRKNPYPFLKNADIVVHLSRFEGKSIALDEAKLFCKPIVVTNFSTVNDQFRNGVNAIIVEMTPEAAAKGIREMIENKVKRDSFISWLKNNKFDNSNEVAKIYNLIGD